MVKKGLMQCCHILKVKEAGFVLNFRILFANATMLFHHVATQWLAKSSSWIHSFLQIITDRSISGPSC